MTRPGPGLVAPFRGIFLRRSVAYWVLAYLMFALLTALGAAMSGQRLPPGALMPGGNLFAPPLVMGVGMLEARRRDEDLFLANLGYGWPVIMAWMLVPAAALEAAFTALRFGGAMLAAYIGPPVAGLLAVLGGGG